MKKVVDWILQRRLDTGGQVGPGRDWLGRVLVQSTVLAEQNVKLKKILCDCNLIIFPILVPCKEISGVAAVLPPGQRSPDVSGQLRPALGERAGITSRHAPSSSL